MIMSELSDKTSAATTFRRPMHRSTTPKTFSSGTSQGSASHRSSHSLPLKSTSESTSSTFRPTRGRDRHGVEDAIDSDSAQRLEYLNQTVRSMQSHHKQTRQRLKRNVLDSNCHACNDAWEESRSPSPSSFLSSHRQVNVSPNLQSPRSKGSMHTRPERKVSLPSPTQATPVKRSQKLKFYPYLSLLLGIIYLCCLAVILLQSVMLLSTLQTNNAVITSSKPTGAYSGSRILLPLIALSSQNLDPVKKTLGENFMDGHNIGDQQPRFRREEKKKEKHEKETSTQRKTSSGTSISSMLTDSIHLTPLQAIDFEKYTIRMNTWKRNEQLITSLDHHARCKGVAQIQVVWCDAQGEPPNEVMNHVSGKVVVERHEANSLNERFNIMVPTPTAGILSLDDDVLRPCEALDSGFFRWTRSPDRLVGYDYRIHVEEPQGWKYAGKSIADKENLYSMVLLRSAFIHRDYLKLYMQVLPRSIFDFVAEKFNCEDIAMSLFVTALTKGKPPLLAEKWAIASMTKLYSHSMISNMKGHKTTRHKCMDNFAKEMGLREGDGRLQSAELLHDRSNIFEIGAPPEVSDELDHTGEGSREREIELKKMLSTWSRRNYKVKMRKILHWTTNAAREKGLIENTTPWEKRWHLKAKKKKS